jgi:hypothetical protein
VCDTHSMIPADHGWWIVTVDSEGYGAEVTPVVAWIGEYDHNDELRMVPFAECGDGMLRAFAGLSPRPRSDSDPALSVVFDRDATEALSFDFDEPPKLPPVLARRIEGLRRGLELRRKVAA